MQQQHPDHTQPSIQYNHQPLHQPNPQMMLCPVQFLYDPRMLVPPGDQPVPTQQFQNQGYLLNVQNTPPWIQQNTTNTVYMPQMQMANNMQPYIPQNMVQNPMFNYQYQPMIMQDQLRHMVPFMQQIVPNTQMVQNVMHHPQAMAQNLQGMVQNPQAMVQNPQAMVHTHPQITAQNPQITVHNHLQTTSQNLQTTVHKHPQTTVQNLQTTVHNHSQTTAHNHAQTTAKKPQTTVHNHTQTIAQNTQTIARNQQTAKIFQALVHNHSQTKINNPQTITQNHQTIAPNPQTLAPNPQTIAPNPQTIAPNPQTLVHNHPQTTAQNQQIKNQNPQTLAKNLQAVVQNHIQTLTNNQQTITQNQQSISQNLQGVVHNPSPTMGNMPQIIIQNPQTSTQGPQVIIRNLHNNTPSIPQNQISHPMEQKQELPLLTQMLQNSRKPPVPEITTPMMIRPQYQFARQQMIIVKPMNKCVHKPTQPVTENTSDVPQDIKSQIPEGLSVKTIYNVPTKVMLKPAEYVLQNLAPGRQPKVSKPGSRNPQTNNKRKTKEISQQNAKDESGAPNSKKCKKEVKIYINIPTTLVEAEGDMVANDWRPPNTINVLPVDKPQNEKLLRNTVYVQARGRVNEAPNIDMQITNNAFQLSEYQNVGAPVNEDRIETNSLAQVSETDCQEQEDESIIVTENNSQNRIESQLELTSNSSEISVNNPNIIKLLSNDAQSFADDAQIHSKITSDSLSNDAVTKDADGISAKTSIMPKVLSDINDNVYLKKPKTIQKDKKMKKTEIKNMVKANDFTKETIQKYVLTHVLDGHIIQESNVPFVVQKSTLSPLKRNPIRREDNEPSSSNKENESLNNIKEKPLNNKEDNEKTPNIEETEISTNTETDIPMDSEETIERGEERETVVEPIITSPDNKTVAVLNEDNPFEHLSIATVKSWTVSDVYKHLMQCKTWIESAHKLSEEEIDGESLILVNKEQLVHIGVCEMHAEVLDKFTEKP